MSEEVRVVSGGCPPCEDHVWQLNGMTWEVSTPLGEITVREIGENEGHSHNPHHVWTLYVCFLCGARKASR